MNELHFQVIQPRSAQVKAVFALTQREPCGTGHQPVDDIFLDTAAFQRDRFVAGFRGDRDDVAVENVALDL